MSTHFQESISELRIVNLDDLVLQQMDAMRSVEHALENFRKINKAKYILGLVVTD